LAAVRRQRVEAHRLDYDVVEPWVVAGNRSLMRIGERFRPAQQLFHRLRYHHPSSCVGGDGASIEDRQ
jgi:hypothetical protein